MVETYAGEGFAGKVVMITGAASGFGALLAQRLSAHGARLVLGDRNTEGLMRVAEALQQTGAEVRALTCDVAQERQVRAMVETAVTQFGRLDIGVNNAGMSTPMKSIIDIEEHELDLNFAVNAKGVLFGMKYQIRQMLQQGGGVILNVASMAGLGAAPKLGPYCAAKHAVVGLTKTAAAEFARRNVRVNAICPFFSATPMVMEGLAEQVEFLAQIAPMKRMATPEEIVFVMESMCHPSNSYMTGQAIAVDGGVSAL